MIYEQKSIAKQMLNPDEHWRIVNLDLSNDDSFCDWTHEREWRIPDEFTFELDKATVVLPNHTKFKRFINKCLPHHQHILKGRRVCHFRRSG